LALAFFSLDFFGLGLFQPKASLAVSFLGFYFSQL
jgi:hypothetical protein